VTGDSERELRATLLRVSEPASPGLVAHVRTHGVAQTLEDIRCGAPIAGAEVEALRHRLESACGARDLDAAAAVGARLVIPGDDEWPLQLDDLGWGLADCLGLWALGRRSVLEMTERSIAIVGTRVATDYGLAVAADLAEGLAEAGWTVVSGLAFGIDGAAHRAALAAGGPTVGVLACGVDIPYPQGHRSLYRRIADEGLVLSEHPPGAAPQRPRFLVRNRIIAALSLGTVVVEMAARSGAKSTAVHAGRVNRHVMCVPGPITSPTSAGCHQFLREHPEAALVTRVAEVIELCGHMGELAEPVRGPASVRDRLGPAVARVLEAVPVRRHATVERIARTALVAPKVVEAALAALEAAGLVASSGDGWAMTTAARRDRAARRAPVGEELPFDDW
jgi:DNA processing protein